MKKDTLKDTGSIIVGGIENDILALLFKQIGREVVHLKDQKEVVRLCERLKGNEKQLINSIPNGIVGVNKEQKIVIFNTQAEGLFGYTESEILGRPLETLLPENKKEEYGKLSSNFIQSPETISIRLEKDNMMGRKKNGEIFPIDISLSYIDTDSERIFIGAVRDLSDLKEKQRIIEEFNKNLEVKVKERTQDLEFTKESLAKSLAKEKDLSDLRSRFISEASHQFRTPLTVIRSNVELLKMLKDDLGEKVDDNFEKIYYRISKQILSMTNLMNDTLVLGRINSGNIVPMPELTDVVDLCKKCVRDFNDIETCLGGYVDIYVSEGSYEVMIDPKLLHNALSNLLSNALKYSKGQQKPIISILFEHNVLKISVKDFGVGIPVKDQEHLFTPFYRGSNVLEHSGTGLGLSIAKEYVELNRGRLLLVNSNENGTEFLITIKKRK